MIDLGLVLKSAAVFLHDARGNRQTQPRAILLGGEERIEQSLLHLGRNAAPGVGHFKDDDVRFAIAESTAAGPGGSAA